jgi:serine/threonine-protein kinase
MGGGNPALIHSTIGEYRVVNFLGAGGMGEVYRAVHSRIGRVAAVKMLAPSALEKEGLTARFLNEARIQGSLQHQNIATLYDFLEVNGQPCIIMEYIDGLTLYEQIDAHGPLPSAEMLRVFRDIVEAVRHIHSFGIIHRDIKANNVKLSSSGQVKLLDFGIAKVRTGQNLTRTGAVVGTIEYIAPEQLEGHKADERSDIWSLGILLYQMATGCAPFTGDTVGEVCLKIVKADYPPPARFNPSLMPDVGVLISRCLKKNPADRYQAAQALLDDVARLALKTATNLPPGKTAVPLKRKLAVFNPLKIVSKDGAWASSHKLFLSVAATTAVVLLVALAIGLYWTLGGGTTAQQGAGEKRTVIIDVAGGQAEIYRDGTKIGVTPLPLETRIDEHVSLTLKREGYVEESHEFTVSAQTMKNFSWTMKKVEKATAP